jgi:hypothetical protein
LLAADGADLKTFSHHLSALPASIEVIDLLDSIFD